ncbi:baseplate tail tube initiator [Aeromonas phage phiAS5]|uniref:Baseplate tail tube initiator n=1 Tax=Aeromonas phage phiAS5 TaxID=879630 RepID=E1A281_9CAUD|nr:tail tube [Aeromonas phage phiAS5]ADM80170.1 baseplate tail tube initiator [Aeromonas phage phiAS5]BES53068.1 hypothetical protein [Aeromonas phage phiWae14]
MAGLFDTAANYIKDIPGKIPGLAQEALNDGLDYVMDRLADDPNSTPDYARFMRVIENRDLARSNTFLVRFGDFKSVAAADGVLSHLEPISSALGQATNGFFGGANFSWNRITDIAYNQAQKHLSPKIKNIMGAIDPTIVRMIPGAGELMDGFLGTGYDVNRDLALMVKSVTLPGTGFETQTNINERTPFTEVRSRTVDPIRMTFYCSPDYAERIWFLTWMGSIHNQKKGTFGFYHNYARDIDIVTLNRRGVMTSVVHSEGCFPTRVGEVQLDFENNNQVATFEVEFTVSTMTQAAHAGKDNLINSVESFYNRVKGMARGIRNA